MEATSSDEGRATPAAVESSSLGAAGAHRKDSRFGTARRTKKSTEEFSQWDRRCIYFSGGSRNLSERVHHSSPLEWEGPASPFNNWTIVLLFLPSSRGSSHFDNDEQQWRQ